MAHQDRRARGERRDAGLQVTPGSAEKDTGKPTSTVDGPLLQLPVLERRS